MNTPSNLIAAAAFSLLAVAGAHAETYEGVQTVNSTYSRSETQAQAIAAAHAANQNVTNGSRVLPAQTGFADRAEVRRQAVATAHAPNQNLDSKAFVNSVVPAQYRINRAVSVTRQAAR